MEELKQKMLNTKLLGIIGLSLMAVSLFMTYVSYNLILTRYSVTPFDFTEGKIGLVLILLAFAILFKEKVNEKFPKIFENNIGSQLLKTDNSKILLIATCIIAAFSFYLDDQLRIGSDLCDNELGFQLYWLGLICLVAYVVIIKRKSTSISNVNSTTSTATVDSTDNTDNTVESTNDQ